MKIDRALFLFLTGAIAGVACHASAPPPVSDQPTNMGATAQSATSASDASAPPPANATATTPATALPSESATSSTHPASTATASASSATPSTATASSTASPKEPPLPPVDSSTLKQLGPDKGCGKGKRTYDDSRTGCDDMQGQYPDCGVLQNGYASSEVCPGPVYVRRRCHLANSNFKPQVSQAVVACLGKTTGKYCNSCNIYQCGYNALMGACPDPTADADCDKIAQTCGGTDKTRCRSYLSGMTQKGRDRMVKCVTSKCEKGFLSCMESLPETL